MPTLFAARPAGPIEHPLSAGQAPAWASEWGDDRFGPFVILEIPKSDSGVVTQRWRWIPPGTFLMGSPKSEPGRSENEGPVHHVTLSTGFWMADTPCTQEFWEAVMRRNPSRFVDPQRPVERVTWSDVRDFVTQLNALVPGLNAELPTEAQWEYACRADSRQALYETPGATGEIEILGECNAPALDWIAWYTGNSGIDFELTEGADSRNWPRKQYPHKKAGTHPVGRKLPNGWGLYDMLGNVWEWCADGRRDYTADPVNDPVGGLAQVEPRVIRGGSWGDRARGVRCAVRYQGHAGYQGDYLGFRLVRVQSGS